MAELSRKFKYGYPTIVNICKRDNEKIKSIASENDLRQNLSTTIRPEIMTKMESLLFIWIKDCNPDNERVLMVENELNNAEKYYSEQVKVKKIQKKIDNFFKPI